MRFLLGIILVAIIAFVLTWVGFSPLNSSDQSDRMGASIVEALKANNFEGVNVRMDGDNAYLSGEIADDTTLKAVKSLAEKTNCETCENSKPIWHDVMSEMTVAKVKAPTIPTASPFTFAANKAADGTVTLNGYVRDENERGRVLREANALFPGKVKDDKVRVALGAPNDNWGNVISEYLKALFKLETGRITLEDNQTLITGTTPVASVRDDIYALAFPAGYSAAANINVPNAEAVVSGNIASEASCQALFNDLKAGKKIEFRSGSANIKPVSLPLLSALSTAAKQCGTFDLSIDGYTDGDPYVAADGTDLNQPLSQARANKVRDYLVNEGVSSERLTSTGHGATNFIASNETADGKAANRRIEFTVTTSE